MCVSSSSIATPVAEAAEQLVGAEHAHLKAGVTREVAEGVRNERLSDADWAEDDHLAMTLAESRRRQLGEDAAVVVDLGLVPSLEHHVGVEPGVVGAAPGSGRLPTRDLVGEDEQEKALERHGTTWRRPRGSKRRRL
jgi:hypothetical protein